MVLPLRCILTMYRNISVPFIHVSRAPEFILGCFGGVRVAHHFSFFVLSYCVSLRPEFRVVMSVTISAYKLYSVRLYLQLFVGEHVSYLLYSCLFAYSGVQHILCTLCCQLLWIVYFWLPSRYSLTFVIHRWMNYHQLCFILLLISGRDLSVNFSEVCAMFSQSQNCFFHHEKTGVYTKFIVELQYQITLLLLFFFNLSGHFIFIL